MGNTPTKSLQKRGKKYVHWSNAVTPAPPGKPTLVPGTPLNQPDVVTIKWEPPIDDGGAPITGYLVEHRRMGSPHWLRATPTLIHTPELTLSGLEPGWRYQFRVSAENEAGMSEPADLSEPLTVTLQRSSVAAPHFLQELNETVVLENDTAEFCVHFRGLPMPKIAWFKDGFEIFSSRRTRIVTENDVSTLVIFQAAFNDEGEIKCAATNRVGHVVTRAKLRLEAPPRIRLPRQYEDGLLFEMGEIIRLKVSVAGRPLPRVSWLHNGEPVVFGGRHEITNTDKSSSLRVGEARREDRGEYQVRATSRLGEDVVSVLVTVTDRPLPPGKAKVVMTLGKSVTLSWVRPEDDGGCKIGNYIVEYYRVGWNVWLKAATCRQLTTTLGDLIEGSEYKFRVKAENPYGVSDPSEESEVVFIPDPKRGLMEAPAKGSRVVEPPQSPPEDQSGKRPIPSPGSGRAKREKRQDLHEEEDRRTKTPESPLIPVTVLEHNSGDLPKRKVIAEEKQTGMNKRRRGKEDEQLPATREEEQDGDYNGLSPEVYSLKIPVGKGAKLEGVTVSREGEHPRDDDESLIHGSSEMMLVLLPQTRDDQSQMDRDEMNNLGVAPPMSLSAPELGGADMFEMPPLRNSLSSTELLHEKTMARFFLEAEAEEMERSLARRCSTDQSADRRRDKERLMQVPDTETTGLKKQREEGKAMTVFKATTKLTEEEQEEADFQRLRERIAKTLEEDFKAVENEMCYMKKDTLGLKVDVADEETEEREMVGEELEEEEVEEEEELVPSEDELEADEELEEDNEIYSQVPTEEIVKKIAPLRSMEPSGFSDDEDECYHPRGLVKMISVIPPPVPAHKEVLTVRTINDSATSALPVRFEPKLDLQPKPILKTSSKFETDELKSKEKEKEKEKIQDKKKSKNDRADTPFSAKEKKEKKPILNKILGKIESPFKKSKSSTEDSEGGGGFLKRKKKDSKKDKKNKEAADEAKKKDELAAAEGLARKDSLYDETEVNRTVVSYYSDLVREYGGGQRKPSPNIFLNTAQLKAAAESSIEESDISVSPEPLSDQQRLSQSPVQKDSKGAISKQISPRKPARSPLPPTPSPPLQKSTSTEDSEEDMSLDEEELEDEELDEEELGEEEEEEKVEEEVPWEFSARHMMARIRRSLTPKPSIKRKRVRVLTPEEAVKEAEYRVHHFINYLTDLAMFLVACWLYLFKDERLAIPVLLLMVYRQIHEALMRWVPKRWRRPVEES